MSALGEQTLVLLLTDTESLNILAKDGLNPQVLPTEGFRPMMEWALAYLGSNDKAPSIEIMRQRWGDLLDDKQIDIEADVEETIGWAIEDLKADYAKLEVGRFVRTLAISTKEAAPEDAVDVLGERASELAKIYHDLQPRTTRVDLRESGQTLLAEYEAASSTQGIRGMRLGLEILDAHYGGIWPGELFVLGGPAGMGKSFVADYVAYKEWARGRCTALFTLENSILMTQMRLACMALGLNITELQTGQLPESDVERLRQWCVEELIESDTPLHIINPETVGRSPQAVVQMAKALEAESLIVDQLSHMAPVDSSQQDRRNEVSSIVRMLADQISAGRHQIPCFLLHQINREGIKRAAGSGRLAMTDFAESSEVERSASVAASLYASEEDRTMGTMQWQTLKARRVTLQDWELVWSPWSGTIIPNGNPGLEI